jgi:polyisoprenyl-phosphate glycosyltransferase
MSSRAPPPTTPDCAVGPRRQRASEAAEVTIVVPVYRSAAVLPHLYRRLTASLERSGTPFTIVLVEDRGGDDSWQVIKRIAAVDARVMGIRLSRNFGQHAAILCGIAHAAGKWIVTLDDDLQHPPESIPALIEKAHEGYHVVYGIHPRRAHGWWRNIGSALARALFRGAIPGWYQHHSSFRIIERTIADALTRFDSPFPSIDGYLSWLTNNCATIPVEHAPRAHGRSGYSFRKLLKHSINIIVTFSNLPMRLALWTGIAAFLLGAVLLVSTLTAHFQGSAVSTSTSIISAVALLTGVQLFLLGIVGEYVARINYKSSRRPVYLIAEEVGSYTARERFPREENELHT